MGSNCCGKSQTLLVVVEKNELISNNKEESYSNSNIIMEQNKNTLQQGIVQQHNEEGMFENENFQNDSHFCSLVEQNINKLKSKEPFTNFRAQQKPLQQDQDICISQMDALNVLITPIKKSSSNEQQNSYFQRSLMEPEQIEKDILLQALELQMKNSSRRSRQSENNDVILTKNHKHQKCILLRDQSQELIHQNLMKRNDNMQNNQLLKLPEICIAKSNLSAITLMKSDPKNQFNGRMGKPPKSTQLLQYRAQKNIQFQQSDFEDQESLISSSQIINNRINKHLRSRPQNVDTQIIPQLIKITSSNRSPSQDQLLKIEVKEFDLSEKKNLLSKQQSQQQERHQWSKQQSPQQQSPQINQKLMKRKNTKENTIIYKPDPKLIISSDLFIMIKRGDIQNYYVMGQEIGKGSFGLVRQVTQKITGITRAMKQIKKSSLFFEKEEVLFSEMLVLKKLVHTNIIKIFEIYQDDESYFIISEYLSGRELSYHLSKIKHFDEQKAANYMLQILQAVSYMHDQGIVHRDLKPQNMIFDDCTENAQLKIIDFGACRKFEKGEIMNKRLGSVHKNIIQQSLMQAQFIAPEVIIRQYNEKCDVWSCGVILFVLLSGKFPFTGINEKQILQFVKIGVYSLERYLTNLDITEEAIGLVKRMLTFDKDQRITAKQALNHPWIQFHNKQKTIDTQTFKNLTIVRKMSIFQQIVVAFMASQLITKDENGWMRNSFKLLDDNQNGSISLDDLQMGLNKKQKTLISQQVINIFDITDLDKNGKIDYNEYVMSAMNKNELLSENKMQQAFAIFDNDQDGYISKKDLENVIGTFEPTVWDQILSDCDSDGDGKISFSEFKECLNQQKEQF